MNYPENNIIICVGHVKPDFKLPDYVYTASFDNGTGTFPLLKYTQLDRIGSHILSEYYWLFNLRRTIQSIGYSPKFITIIQYRRFVVNNQSLGRSFSNLGYSKYMNSNEIEKLDFSDVLLPLKANMLFNEPIDLAPHNILTDYNKNHILRDLLRFSADSLETFLLDPGFILKTFFQKTLIPAPSIGTFELNFFLSTLNLLENIALNYIQGGFLRRSGYQSRSLGFILERFHSQILLQNCVERGSEIETGFHVVHSETDLYSSNPN